MVKIPGGAYDFRVQGVETEGNASNMVDVQYPWEPTPRRFHEHTLEIKPFFIDKYPVTNASQAVLDATHYAPKDSINFLHDWPQDASKPGRFPEGWENRPVTWVSLEDARSYAHWAGKRLPHEWEWQLAAQGPISPDSPAGRVFPWATTGSRPTFPRPTPAAPCAAPTPSTLILKAQAPTA